jgi:hypothetical protein
MSEYGALSSSIPVWIGANNFGCHEEENTSDLETYFHNNVESLVDAHATDCLPTNSGTEAKVEIR